MEKVQYLFNGIRGNRASRYIAVKCGRKLKDVFLFSVLFFISGNIKSQYNSEFLKYSDYGKHVSVYTDGEFNSTSMTNGLADKFVLGGYIDSTTKRNAAGRMKDMNYLGGNFNYGINVFFGKDSSNFHWYVGVKDQQYINGTFTRDLFNVTFFGNDMYKGKSAYFDNSGISYAHFQEIKFGFIKVDSLGKLGIGLSLLKGQSMFQFNAVGANSLFTAADATQLDLNAHFTMHKSNSANNGLNAMNGSGVALDLYSESPYQSCLGAGKFIVSVSNFGFINWSNKTTNYYVDSLFHFSGYSIHSINDLKDTTLNAISRDSIVSHITHVSKSKYDVMLPMNFLVIHQLDFTNYFSLKTGVRHIFNGNYKPFFFADAKFRLNKSVSAGMLMAYGGYGKLTSGLYVECNLKKKWYLKVGSNCIQGFIDRDQTLGQSAYLTFAKKF